MTVPVAAARFLADTSAWVEYLRATGSPADSALRDAARDRARVATTGVVVQEVLAGARNDAHAADLGRLLNGCAPLEPAYPATYAHAAALHRRCRRAGRQVRGTVDCQIAAIALEYGIAVLATDRDMATLHEVCGVALWPVDG